MLAIIKIKWDLKLSSSCPHKERVHEHRRLDQATRWKRTTITTVAVSVVDPSFVLLFIYWPTDKFCAI